MSGREYSVIITCEHGGNRVPRPFASLFRSAAAVLRSHRGYDIGALAVARAVAREFRAPFFSSTITRLLVDLNRSIEHPACYSEFTRHLPPAVKARIRRRHYDPYRNAVQGGIAREIRGSRPVLHISVHSFTPELHGEVRNADTGLLYDQSRRRELDFCLSWRASLRNLDPTLRVRRNYPYLGRSDGLTAAFRRRFPARAYLGVELEVNQAILTHRTDARRITLVILDSLRDILHAGR